MEDNSNIPEPEIINDSTADKVAQLKPAMPPVQAALFAVIGIFFLYQVGGSLLAILIFGTDLSNVDLNALRLLTMGGQVLLMLLPALWFTKVVYRDVTTVLRIKLPNWKEIIVFILGWLLLMLVLKYFLDIQNFFITWLAERSSFFAGIKESLDWLNDLVGESFLKILKTENIFEIILIFVVVSFTPAICEEVLFRGFVQRSFELQLRPLIAIIITSAFFALYHFNPYGLISIGAIGLYLGFSAYLSNSILIPMIIHFLNNFLQLALFYAYGSEEVFEDTLAGSSAVLSHSGSFLILLLLFSAFIYYVNKHYPTIKGEAK